MKILYLKLPFNSDLDILDRPQVNSVCSRAMYTSIVTKKLNVLSGILLV